MTDHESSERALVVYASTPGHTAKIATRIAAAMCAHGMTVDVRDVAAASDVVPGEYDLVVVGASLHREEHQQEMMEWVAARREALTEMPSAFLSASLSAADDSAESIATQRCIDTFLARTGWTPTRTERIAGSLQYRECDLFTRQLMRC